MQNSSSSVNITYNFLAFFSVTEIFSSGAGPEKVVSFPDQREGLYGKGVLSEGLLESSLSAKGESKS